MEATRNSKSTNKGVTGQNIGNGSNGGITNRGEQDSRVQVGMLIKNQTNQLRNVIITPKCKNKGRRYTSREKSYLIQ